MHQTHSIGGGGQEKRSLACPNTQKTSSRPVAIYTIARNSAPLSGKRSIEHDAKTPTRVLAPNNLNPINQAKGVGGWANQRETNAMKLGDKPWLPSAKVSMF